MHMVNKLISSLFLALLSQISAWADSNLSLGAVFGLSGSVARYGQWAQRGVELALADINEEGGIDGKQLSVIFEDNQGKPAQAVVGFKKLRAIQRIDYFLTYQSSIALAVSPLANREGVIQMDVSAFTPAYSSPGDFTFRTGVLATELSDALAQVLTRDFNVRRLTALYIENDKGESGFQSFKQAFSGEIAFHDSFKPDENDYRPFLLRIRASGINDLFLCGHLKESGLMLKQAKELGLNLRVFSDVYSVEGQDFLEVAGQAAENVIYVAPYFASQSKSRKMHEFYQRYQARYSERPTYFSAQAYDGTFALATAIKQCHPVTTHCVKDQLYNIEFDGASGRIKFDRNGDVTQKPIGLKVVRSGEFVEYRPDA